MNAEAEADPETPNQAGASDASGDAAAPAPDGGAGRESKSRRRRKKGGGGGGAQKRPSQYWMVVTSPENFLRTREHGFTMQGIKSRHRRRVETMRPGDRLLYYVTGRMAFAATCTVSSSMYEDHQVIWRSGRPEEDYPWRVKTNLDVLLDEPEWVAAKDIAFRLEYVRKWPPENWTLAFQGHLHQLPQSDLKLVETELERMMKKRRRLAG